MRARRLFEPVRALSVDATDSKVPLLYMPPPPLRSHSASEPFSIPADQRSEGGGVGATVVVVVGATVVLVVGAGAAVVVA